jgi:pimeloyl-ACP methyl ester carboxylesterase
VRTIRGGGHAVMVTDPAEYVHSVLDFLQEP